MPGSPIRPLRRLCLALAGGALCVAAAADPRLEGVVVTAQKRTAALQDVPAALTVHTASDLAAAGLHSLYDVAERSPMLDVQRSTSPTTTSLRIRRVGNLGNVPTFEPAVGLFVDGAFRSRSMPAAGDLLDVDRVEILSGPQSALYGKNVTAGLTAIHTAPPPERPAAQVEIGGGWFDAPGSPTRSALRLTVGGPITRELRASFAASHVSQEHVIENVLTGSDGDEADRLAARAQALWRPSEQFDLRLIAGYLREHDDQGESDVYFAPNAGSTALLSAIQRSGLAPVCAENAPHNRRTCSIATNTLELDAHDVTLLGDYRLPNGWTVSSVTAWERYEALRREDDAVQLLSPILFYHDAEQAESWQQELRLTSPADARVSWLAGVFYYRNEYERGDDGNTPMFGANGELAFHPLWTAVLGAPLALPGQLGLHDSQLATDYLGVFGHVDWRLSRRWSLVSALRWQREDKQASIRNAVTAPGASLISVVLAPTSTIGGEPVNGSVGRRMQGATWSLTPVFRASENASAWFTWSRGVKSGGFNTGFGNAPLAAREFDDEDVRHLELGVRSLLAQGRVRLSAAAFHTTFENYQDAAFVSAQFAVGNATEVHLEGFEFEGRALLGERVALELSVSRADLRYRKHTTGLCYPGRAPDGDAPGACDLSGERPIAAPLWSTSLALQYEQPVRSGDLFARIDWSWTDDYQTSFSADPRLVQDAYSDVGARAGYRWDRYELTLWGDNLLNEEIVYVDALLNLFADASYQSFLAPPRSFGATVRVRF